MKKEKFEGCCQRCGNQQRLNKDLKLVNHGYARPGVGYIVGKCPGVGYSPVQIDTSYLDSIVKQHEIVLSEQPSLNINESRYSSYNEDAFYELYKKDEKACDKMTWCLNDRRYLLNTKEMYQNDSIVSVKEEEVK